MLIVMIRPFKKQFGIYNSIHALLILDLIMLLSIAMSLDTAFVQALTVTYSIIIYHSMEQLNTQTTQHGDY